MQFRIRNMFTNKPAYPSTEAWNLALYSGHLQTHATTCYPRTLLCILNLVFHSSFLFHFVFLRSVCRLLVMASVVPSSLILVTLMMEALSSSKTSVLTRAAWCNIPKDIILHSHLCENLKSYIALTVGLFNGNVMCLL
jgi:hypothetical protein